MGNNYPQLPVAWFPCSRQEEEKDGVIGEADSGDSVSGSGNDNTLAKTGRALS